MFKQKWLWGVMILLLIISSPGIINRWNAETSNNTYETIIPYEEILEVTKKSDLTTDEVLATLKEAGLTTVSLEPISLMELKEQNLVSIFESDELAELLHFSAYKDDVDVEKNGYYITIPKDENIKRLIDESIQLEQVKIAGEPFYFLPFSNEDVDLWTAIGFDELAIEKINQQDLMHIFRVPNSDSIVMNAHIVQQLLALKNDHVSGIISTNSEVLGFGQELQDTWIKQLSQSGYDFYTIEFNRIKGESKIAKITDYQMVRLFSIDSGWTLNDSIDKTTRAVKERNIKALFYHIPLDGNAEDSIEKATKYLTGVNEEMPSQFISGSSKPFEVVSVPTWVTALVLLAGTLFTYLASEILKYNKLRIAATLFMALLSVSYLGLNKQILLQGFALIIAVITPIYAIIKTAKGSLRIRDILFQYLKAVGISLIGITIVIGLLNGNGYLTGFEMFRGVKLVYIIPILAVLLFVLIEISNLSKGSPKAALTKTVTLLNKDIKYWHLLILMVIAAVGMFYIIRSGNSSAVSSSELMFRQWLEDTLYVRPRTKEFLIGLPFFILALYVMGKYQKSGKILLVISSIGFLSMVNTFTHFHIPIEVSLLRTFYSVVLGFVIGLVFIAIFKIGLHFISKAKTRWS